MMACRLQHRVLLSIWHCRQNSSSYRLYIGVRDRIANSHCLTEYVHINMNILCKTLEVCIITIYTVIQLLLVFFLIKIKLVYSQDCKCSRLTNQLCFGISDSSVVVVFVVFVCLFFLFIFFFWRVLLFP